MLILPALQKNNYLEILSMSVIQCVCDKFVKGLIPVHGSNLKELANVGCFQVFTDSYPMQYCSRK